MAYARGRARRIEAEVEAYLDDPPDPPDLPHESPSRADRALDELDRLAGTGTPYPITQADVAAARVVREEALAGRAPDWQARAGGTRRYRWLVQQLGPSLRL